jgi:Fe-S-cluster containining protein
MLCCDALFLRPMHPDEHQLDKVGEHDTDECEVCFEQEHAVCSSCRCGRCCAALLIEVSLRDAEREPRIRQEAGPIYEDYGTETRELIGYLLNGKDGPCVFLDRQTKLCTIHDTRPLVCRVFNCDTYEHKADSTLDDEPR